MTDKPIDWQARRDGFDHKPAKSPDTTIRWKFWGDLKDIKQWEACALSLNINPDSLKRHPQAWMAGPGSGPIFTEASFPSKAAKIEFDRRLQILNRIAKGNLSATVNPVEFAALCLHLEFSGVPPELVALANVTQPEPTQDTTTTVAKPSTPAAPVVEDEGPELDYGMLATREQLLDAFAKWGLDEAWFADLNSHHWLLDARRQKGQGQRGHVIEPLFCPFDVMSGLIRKVRKAKRLNPDVAWRTLEHKFPKVYATFETFDPRDQTGD